MVTKRDLKISQNNDVYALKINSGIYRGKYLILIKHCNLDWLNLNNILFRAKITNDFNIPKNKDEIENLEYIKESCIEYEKRFLPLSNKSLNKMLIEERSKTTFYPDEYNYLYKYIFQLYVRKNDCLDNLIYLGNFIISPPKDEYYPFSIDAVHIVFFPQLEKMLINSYEGLNLRKYQIYDIDRCKEIHEEAEMIMNILLNNEELDYQYLNLKDSNKNNSLTYVGGEDKDPYEELEKKDKKKKFKE